jgi:hypothetical protein
MHAILPSPGLTRLLSGEPPNIAAKWGGWAMQERQETVVQLGRQVSLTGNLLRKFDTSSIKIKAPRAVAWLAMDWGNLNMKE